MAQGQLFNLPQALPEGVFKLVERKLYEYPMKKRLIEAYDAEETARNVALAQGSRWEGWSPGRAAVGDPTAARATKLINIEERVAAARWDVRAIEDVLKILSPIDRQLVELKYFQGYLSHAGIARKLNISERDFYRRRERIVARFAVRMGLF